jgi:hypothetical protein
MYKLANQRKKCVFVFVVRFAFPFIDVYFFIGGRFACRGGKSASMDQTDIAFLLSPNQS